MIDKKHIQTYHNGNNNAIYRFMGAHKASFDGIGGYTFTVWAPHAAAVDLILPEWISNTTHRLIKYTHGVWSVFIPYATANMRYYYEIYDIDHRKHRKSDPVAFQYEMRPGKCAITTDFSDLEPDDAAWDAQRHNQLGHNRPINIYEVHAGTWRKHWHGKFYTYRDMARELCAYCQDNGYTHIELLPITEHPLDQSMGYQPSGYFAPTQRFGTPQDFKAFVEECHRSNLGVILDWVPSHFCIDNHALAYFDGRACYEYDTQYMTHGNRWGAHCFDLGRKEVRSFLMSSALFWFDIYNIDGMRVDAVSDLLDIRNRNKDNAAVEFIRQLHAQLYAHHPYALSMAEDSNMRGMVTQPYDKGGLGFTHQWNMGWTFDVLSYLRRSPDERMYDIKALAKTLDYATREQFLIPLSHDISSSAALRKFPGKTKEKLAHFMLLYTYFMIHPGAKLAFMGTEWGGQDVWRMHKEITWPKSRRGSKHHARQFARRLNAFYLTDPVLWPTRASDNFCRLNKDDNTSGVLVVARRSGFALDIAIMNFSYAHYQHYAVGVQLAGNYQEICRSDEKDFGGKELQLNLVSARPQSYAGEPNTLDIDVPPLGVVILRRVGD